MNSFFLKRIFAFLTLFVLSSNILIKETQAIKIVATVNEASITDYDVDIFADILCSIDKNIKCKTNESWQMALMTLIEANLKFEHIKQTGFDLKQIENDFQDYKKKILKTLKTNSNVDKDVLEWYLKSEYIWGMILSSQVRQEAIKESEIEEFIKKNKIDTQSNSKEDIKNMLFNKKMALKSRSMMDEMKKYYLVEIKI